MAALNARNDGTGRVTIMVEVEKACYPICTLTADKIPQQALDYVFTEGEEVLFYTEGDLDVHLTGMVKNHDQVDINNCYMSTQPFKS